MIRYMLDTNICIDLIRGRARNILRQMERFEIDEIAISSITLAELQFGVVKSADPKRHQPLLVEFCAPLAILPFANQAAQEYGRLREALERTGTPIGPLDTLIAAHALAVDCTLVTNNEREFQRVDGLVVENWTKPDK